MKKLPIGVATALLAFLMTWPGAGVASAQSPYVGTFTSMYYHPDSGDLVGDEIRIVVSRRGYQGTLQRGLGEPTDLALFRPTFDGERVNFTVEDPFDGDPLSFEGRIDVQGLRGQFRNLEGHGLWSIDLKRGISYWDRGVK